MWSLQRVNLGVSNSIFTHSRPLGLFSIFISGLFQRELYSGGIIQALAEFFPVIEPVFVTECQQHA